MSRVFRLSAILTFFVALSATAATEKTEIVMGFNPAENAEVIENNSKAFAEYYKKATGLNVKTFIATDYTALIEAMRSGRVDFAWLPPFSFVKGEKVADAQVLLKSVRNGNPFYYACIISKADKNITKIEELKGKSIAWVDPSSSAGHVFPKSSVMKKLNVDADKFFSRQVFAGSHDALVLSVVNGTVDAGATFCNDAKGGTGAWTQFLKGEEAKKVRVVHVTDPIPGDTMTASKKFIQANPNVVEKTVKVLVAMGGTPEGKKILNSLYRIDAVTSAKSEDYEPVRNAARLLNILE